jgi:brefeldin A-inhibited guanine nucleotide-exchange protein
MLNTDQHNAQIKRRMTKQDFVKNNRGIDEGKDLPEEYLCGIFDEITSNEIVLNEEQAQKATNQGNSEIGAYYNKDMVQVANANEAMAMNTEAKFNNMKSKVLKRKNSDDIAVVFYEAKEYEHVKSMLQLVWSASLSCLSTPLQETEDEDVIRLALEGFKSAIHITCLFGMEAEKNAFVSTLAKLSLPANISEVRSKSLDCIRCLLDIANYESNSFSECWKDILSCISQLESLGLLGSDGENEIIRIRK